MSERKILLADDDQDDCMLFQDALAETCAKTTLEIANNGQVLMDMLYSMPSGFPDMIFLDLNMPRKNGLECLDEIRSSARLKKIPVIIFSTTIQDQSVNATYAKGANYYVQKPSSFSQLKKVIEQVLQIDWSNQPAQPAMNEFTLYSDKL